MRGLVLAVVFMGTAACNSRPTAEGPPEACRGLAIRCSETCIDLLTDANQCGVCGNACAPSEVCTEGRCTAPCPQPALDIEGTLVGEFPALASCRAGRYDVDADGVLDDVCGAFRIQMEPFFSIEPTGIDQGPSLDSADLLPSPGVEFLRGCSVNDAAGALVATFEPPCAPAGNGVGDIDNDGDFDVIFADGFD